MSVARTSTLTKFYGDLDRLRASLHDEILKKTGHTRNDQDFEQWFAELVESCVQNNNNNSL